MLLLQPLKSSSAKTNAYWSPSRFNSSWNQTRIHITPSTCENMKRLKYIRRIDVLYTIRKSTVCGFSFSLICLLLLISPEKGRGHFTTARVDCKPEMLRLLRATRCSHLTASFLFQHDVLLKRPCPASLGVRERVPCPHSRPASAREARLPWREDPSGHSASMAGEATESCRGRWPPTVATRYVTASRLSS